MLGFLTTCMPSRSSKKQQRKARHSEHMHTRKPLSQIMVKHDREKDPFYTKRDWLIEFLHGQKRRCPIHSETAPV